MFQLQVIKLILANRLGHIQLPVSLPIPKACRDLQMTAIFKF